MALKLQGIDPRPPAPHPPSVPIEALPTDNEALIRIWRPQAALRAEQGESEFAIARFLHSKGVEGSAAQLAAREIAGGPDPTHSFRSGLAKTTGIILLILGLLLPVLCFAWNPGMGVTLAVLAGCLLGVTIGCKLLWPGSAVGQHRPDGT